MFSSALICVHRRFQLNLGPPLGALGVLGGSILLVLINSLRIDQRLANHFPAPVRPAAEEAALEALVTRRPGLVDLQQHGVAVAVDVRLAHLLDVAAFLTLPPEPAAAAAEVAGPAGGDRFFPRLAVHVGEH